MSDENGKKQHSYRAIRLRPQRLFTSTIRPRIGLVDLNSSTGWLS